MYSQVKKWSDYVFEWSANSMPNETTFSNHYYLLSFFVLKQSESGKYDKYSLCYSWPKPSVSRIASSNFSFNCSYDLYGGRSSRLKHVWERGNWFSLPTFSITNFCGPLDPISSAKPPCGRRQVPVTKDNSLERSSLLSSSRSKRQNHTIWREFFW